MPFRIGSSNVNSLYVGSNLIGSNTQIGGLDAGLLNVYGDAALALSFRRLDKYYTGPAVRLERTGGATKDFYFQEDGTLDTGSIETWVAGGGSQAVIDTWYDQSGNNNNAVKVLGGDIAVVSSGTTFTSNGVVSPYWNGGSIRVPNDASLQITGDMSLFAVSTTSSTSIGSLLNKRVDDSNREYQYGLVSNSIPRYQDSNNSQNGTSVASTEMFSHGFDRTANSNIKIYHNTSSLADASLTGTLSSTAADLYLGEYSDTTTRQYVGYYSELILYPSNMNSSRTSIFTDYIAPYYSL